jgi:hypothetical protein
MELIGLSCDVIRLAYPLWRERLRCFFIPLSKKRKVSLGCDIGEKAGELEKGNIFKGNFQFHDIFSIS